MEVKEGEEQGASDHGPRMVAALRSALCQAQSDQSSWFFLVTMSLSRSDSVSGELTNSVATCSASQTRASDLARISGGVGAF